MQLLESNEVQQSKNIINAESRIESIHCGINALGEMMQVIDPDAISKDSMKNIGFMLVVLSDVACGDLQIIYKTD